MFKKITLVCFLIKMKIEENKLIFEKMQNIDLAKPATLQCSKIAKHAKAYVSHAIYTSFTNHT